jgi:hypothetical protein
VIFAIREVHQKTVVVYDEAKREERTIPRLAIELALRRRKLVYLGMERKRRSA